MEELSHIAMFEASPDYHTLFMEGGVTLGHYPRVESQNKNGGPNFLRAWREHRGLSQEKLAELVGTSQNQIAYLESGGRALSAKWLRRLAPILDTTPGMLLDHDPSELDADIIDIWASASARERRQISEIARTLRRTGTGD